MPELPEVETIKNCLLMHIAGHQFTNVLLLWPRIVHQPSPEEFYQRIIGQTIKDIGRRGKYLLLYLDQETLILHLKMTGVLLLQNSCDEIKPHTRAVFFLDNDTKLSFCDQRKFGAIWLVKDEREIVAKLGPEPLTNYFTPETLSDILHRHSMPIKSLLCDQNIIAGIGNMYTDETLFSSGIHPLRKSNELSREEVNRLYQAIHEALTSGIKYGGASVDTYQHPDGKLGSAQSFFKVAHRRNQLCLNCGTNIERIPIRGRGTYFCPKCQKL